MKQKIYLLREFTILAILLSVSTLSVAQKTFNYSQLPNFNDWNNPNNWTPSGVPTSTDDVIIPGSSSYTVQIFNGYNAACNNYTQNGGDVAVGGFLRIHGNLTWNSTGNFFVYGIGSDVGTVSILGSASNTGGGRMVLYQNNSNSNAGYRHWGSVFNGGTLNDMNLAGNGFTVQGGNNLDCYYGYTPYPNVQRFNEATSGSWYHGWISFTNTSTPMDKGRGYAFRTDAPGSLGTDWISTNGAIWNAGPFATASSFSGSGWDLFANPYPGSFDLAGTLGLNSGCGGISTAHLFQATGQYTGNWGTVDYFGNTTGGATTSIAPGQGFFVQNFGCPFIFDPASMSNTATALYKTDNVTNKVRIKLSNGNNWNDMLACTTGSLTYEGSEVFTVASDINASFNKNGKDYVINNLADITVQTELPVSFMANAAGTYTVSLTENETNGLTVFLKDNQTNTYTNLSNGTASISLPANTKVSGRYAITFEAAPSGISNAVSSANVYVYDQVLHVNRDQAVNASVVVIDALGRLLAKYDIANQKEAIDLSSLNTSGMLVVKVTEGKNITTAKVVMN